MAAWRSMDDDMAPFWERAEDRAVETGETGTFDDYGIDWFDGRPDGLTGELVGIIDRFSLDMDVLSDLRAMNDWQDAA